MSQPPGDSLTFEESLAELDRIVRELEDGKLGLEDALCRYETGVGLLKRCYTQLQQVEQRILQLRFFADKTQAEIGAELGISQMHVSRLLSRTLLTLRQQMQTD